MLAPQESPSVAIFAGPTRSIDPRAGDGVMVSREIDTSIVWVSPVSAPSSLSGRGNPGAFLRLNVRR